MSWIDDAGLFGHDMRNSPKPRIMPPGKQRNLHRYYGYGTLPPGYVTVDVSSLDSIPDSAIRFDRRKYAIPLREFARIKQLTIREQWILMNMEHRLLFYHDISDVPSLNRALEAVINTDKESQFFSLFWDIKKDPLYLVLKNEVSDNNHNIQHLKGVITATMGEITLINTKEKKSKRDIQRRNALIYYNDCLFSDIDRMKKRNEYIAAFVEERTWDY